MSDTRVENDNKDDYDVSIKKLIICILSQKQLFFRRLLTM